MFMYVCRLAPVLVMHIECSPLQSLLTFSNLRRNATAKVREVCLRGSSLLSTHIRTTYGGLHGFPLGLH